MYVSMAQGRGCNTDWTIGTSHCNLLWPCFGLFVATNNNHCDVTTDWQVRNLYYTHTYCVAAQCCPGLLVFQVSESSLRICCSTPSTETLIIIIPLHSKATKTKAMRSHTALPPVCVHSQKPTAEETENSTHLRPWIRKDLQGNSSWRNLKQHADPTIRATFCLYM